MDESDTVGESGGGGGMRRMRQVDVINSFLDQFNTEEYEARLVDDFEQLRNLSNEIRIMRLKTSYEGEKEVNKRKNRYRDILPFDENRVKLDSFKSDNQINGSDYINASFVNSSIDSYYKYLAAQGPTRETCIDFVRMLVQYKVKIVICACNEYEGNKLKCHRYWTDSLDEPYCIYKDYYAILQAKPVEFEDCIIRQLKVKHIPASAGESSSEFEYDFMQIHLNNWPDHGVPDNVEPVINILSMVRQKMIENNKQANESYYKMMGTAVKGQESRRIVMPLSNDYLVVHCSAGCGRTGTIIAIDQLWNLLNENKLDENFSLYGLASILRQQRVAMIQTLSQYAFFGKATAFLFDKYLKSYKPSPPPASIMHSSLSQPVIKNQNSIQDTTSDSSGSIAKSYKINFKSNKQINSGASKPHTPPTHPLSIDKLKYISTVYQMNNSSKLKPHLNNSYSIDVNNNLQIDTNSSKAAAAAPSPLPSTGSQKSKSQARSSSVARSTNLAGSNSSTMKQKISKLVPNMFSMFTSSASSPTSPNNESGEKRKELLSVKSDQNNNNTCSSTSPSPISLSSTGSSSLSQSGSKTCNKSNTMVRSSTDHLVAQVPSKSLTETSNKESMAAHKITPLGVNNRNQRAQKINTSDFITSPTQNGTVVNRRDLNSPINIIYKNAGMTSNGLVNLRPTASSALAASSSKSPSPRPPVVASVKPTYSFNDRSDLAHLHVREEPGSVCEFLSNRLATASDDNDSSSASLGTANEYTKGLRQSASQQTGFGKDIRVNQIKMSSSQQTDLRQSNPPRKAEFYEAVAPDLSESSEPGDGPVPPQAPARIKTNKRTMNLVLGESGDRSSLNSKLQQTISNTSNSSSVSPSSPMLTQKSSNYADTVTPPQSARNMKPKYTISKPPVTSLDHQQQLQHQHPPPYNTTPRTSAAYYDQNLRQLRHNMLNLNPKSKAPKSDHSGGGKVASVTAGYQAPMITPVQQQQMNHQSRKLSIDLSQKEQNKQSMVMNGGNTATNNAEFMNRFSNYAPNPAGTTKMPTTAHRRPLNNYFYMNPNFSNYSVYQPSNTAQTPPPPPPAAPQSVQQASLGRHSTATSPYYYYYMNNYRNFNPAAGGEHGNKNSGGVPSTATTPGSMKRHSVQVVNL